MYIKLNNVLRNGVNVVKLLVLDGIMKMSKGSYLLRILKLVSLR
jgi:hypothetical protein